MGMDCRRNCFSQKRGDLSVHFSLGQFYSGYAHWFRVFLEKVSTAGKSFFEIQMKLVWPRLQKITVFQLPLAVVPWSEIETKIGGLMCLLSAFYTNSIDLTDDKIKSGWS